MRLLNFTWRSCSDPQGQDSEFINPLNWWETDTMIWLGILDLHTQENVNGKFTCRCVRQRTYDRGVIR